MIKANRGQMIFMCNLYFVKKEDLKWAYVLLKKTAKPFNWNNETCCELVPECQI